MKKSNQAIQARLFEESDKHVVEFQIVGKSTQITRIMTKEECQDFIDFLDVFAIQYNFANIKNHESNNQTRIQ
jgi:hypothetical protein